MTGVLRGALAVSAGLLGRLRGCWGDRRRAALGLRLSGSSPEVLQRLCGGSPEALRKLSGGSPRLS
eukprot:9418750-Alexandrium_andersonii.AAC.1